MLPLSARLGIPIRKRLRVHSDGYNLGYRFYPRSIERSVFKYLRLIGRGERIRTSGPCLPKTVLYQAELLPDRRSRADPGRGRGGPIGAGSWAGKQAFGMVARCR